MDEQTLIILDESHHMRNVGSIKNVRLSHQRIVKAVNERGAKILMMTATPYSTGIDDINAQLMLLPCFNEQGIFGNAYKYWKISNSSELSELPPELF